MSEERSLKRGEGMKTILVDDKELAFRVFEKELKGLQGIQIVGKFSSAYEAIEYVSNHEVELAFVDIQTGTHNGIDLAKALREINPKMLLIFITDHEEYAMASIKLNAVAYLLKPYTKEELAYAVESAFLLSRRNYPKLYARTFGHFDFFVNGKPIMFKSAKAKELMVLLIDRQGGTITTDQIIATLWEERPNDEATQNLASKIVKTLQDELANAGVEDLIISSRGVKRIDTERFDCDLYDLLAGNEDISKIFLGEYLSEYSWAEPRASALVQLYKKELMDNY